MMTETAESERTYAVHLFPVVRLKVPQVRASSPDEAIERAQELVGSTVLYRLFGREADPDRPYERPDAEWNEAFGLYLVDELDASGEIVWSQFYESRDNPLVSLVQRLVEWDRRREEAADSGVLQAIVADAREILERTV